MAASEAPATDPASTIKLWDLPVRLVHWSLVALMPVLWWTAENGKLDLHKTLGYAILGLVAFRLAWGLVGSATARFAQFVRGPGAILAYLRGTGAPTLGHNPIGALSVLALLGLLMALIGFGLFAQDVDGTESGPLSYLVSYETADAARGWHNFSFNVLLGLIAIHLLAIGYYRLIKGERLVGPMVTGNKAYDRPVTAPAIAPVWLALAIAAGAGGFAWWISIGAPLPGSNG